MVKLNTDQPGLSGLGDASPMQNDAEVMSVVEELTARYLVGKDPLDSGVLHNVLYMDQQARGGRIANDRVIRDRHGAVGPQGQDP